MRANTQTTFGEILALTGLLMTFVGLFFSPFISSMGTVVMLVALVARLKALQGVSPLYLLLFAMPLLLILTDFMRFDNQEHILNKLLLAAGFLVFGYTVKVYHDSWPKFSRYILLTGLISMLLVNGITVTQYFLDKETLDALLLQSKSIPVFGGMHHIHFGILNAITIAFGLYFLLFKPWTKNSYWLLAAVLILLFSFHTLSSRTGLFALYSALLGGLFIYTMEQRSYRIGLVGLSLVILVNVAALQWSSSFKNKLANSIEDINSWEGQAEDVNFKSMGMRFEAYKMCLLIIQDNPIMGVGTGAMDETMQDYYKRSGSSLYEENRVGPHNQLLEYGVKFGFMGMLYVLAFFIYWFVKALKPIRYGFLVVVLLLIVSVQFESLFERQVSIFITACILPLAESLLRQEN